MTVYILIFVSLMLLSFAELFSVKKKKIKFFWGTPVIVTFLVLTTIRGGTKGDYVTYKETYMYMVNTSTLWVKENFHYEPLYSLLQWGCKKVIDDFQFFLFVIGAIVIFLEHRFAMSFAIRGNGCSQKINIERTGRYYFTVFFALWGLYLANIFVTRNTISLIICFYSLKFIQEKKFKKYLLCVVIAIGFHYSAIVFLPAYFIFWCGTKLITKVNLFISGSVFLSISIRPIALIAANILGGRTEVKIKRYLNATDFMFATGMNESSATILLIKAILNIGILLIVGIYFWKFNKNDKFYEGCLNLYIVGCILHIATLTVGHAFARLSIYYNIFQIPILIYAIKENAKANDNRKVYWMLLVLYIMVRFVVNNIGTPFVAYWQ